MLMMKQRFQFYCAQHVLGRVLLHSGCLLRGGRWEFHWAGVRRELARLF